METIDLQIHTREGEEPKTIKIASDATVEQLVKELQAAGASVGEPGEEIILWVENEEVKCHKGRKIHEHGIKHGHHVAFHKRHHKAVKIFVNGREETITKHKITYEEVVDFAYPKPDFQGNTYKVTYLRKGDKHREGTLTKGESIEVTDCMIFTVIRAVRS